MLRIRGSDEVPVEAEQGGSQATFKYSCPVSPSLLLIGLFIYPAVFSTFVLTGSGPDARISLSPGTLVAAGVCGSLFCLQLLAINWARAARLERAGTTFKYFTFARYPAVTFKQEDVLGVRFVATGNGASKWILRLPNRYLTVSDRFKGVSDLMWDLQRSSVSASKHANTSPSQGDFASPEAASSDSTYRYGFQSGGPTPGGRFGPALLASIMPLFGVVFLLTPHLAFSVGQISVALIIGTVIEAAILRLAGSALFERLEVRSGTYTYFDWRNRQVAKFSRNEIQAVRRNKTLSEKPTSWTLHLGDRSVTLSSRMTIEAIIADLEKRLPKAQPDSA